jgi:hypothetical protein
MALLAHETSHILDGSSRVAIQRSVDSVNSSVIDSGSINWIDVRQTAEDPNQHERLREAMLGITLNLNFPPHVRKAADDVLRYLEYMDVEREDPGALPFYTSPADLPASGEQTDLSSMYRALPEPEKSPKPDPEPKVASPEKGIMPGPPELYNIPEIDRPRDPDVGHASVSQYVMGSLRAGGFSDRYTLEHILQHIAAGDPSSLHQDLVAYASESKENACQVLAMLKSLEDSGVTGLWYIAEDIENFDEAKRCDNPIEGPNWPNPDTIDTAKRLATKQSNEQGGFVQGPGAVDIGGEAKIIDRCIGVLKVQGFMVPKMVGKITEPGGLGPKAQLTRSRDGWTLTPGAQQEILRIGTIAGEEIIANLQFGLAELDDPTFAINIVGPLGFSPVIKFDKRYVTITFTIPPLKGSRVLVEKPDGSKAEVAIQLDMKFKIDTQELCAEVNPKKKDLKRVNPVRLPNVEPETAARFAISGAAVLIGAGLLLSGVGSTAGAGLLVMGGGGLTLGDDEEMH